MHHLECIGFEVDEDEKQPIFRRREEAVLIHAKPAGGAGFPSKASRRHRRLKRGLKGRDELLKLIKSQAGKIQELCGGTAARQTVNQPMGRASCHDIVISEAHHTRKQAGET